MNDKPLVSLVTPFFNEETIISTFVRSLIDELNKTGHPFELVCVDDGSTDGTFEGLKREQTAHPEIRIIRLSRNFGKENALTAGLDFAAGDLIIPIDADLQDPPELIPTLLDYWKQGYDVVLPKRGSRHTDSVAKRLSSALFYRIHNLISDTRIPENVGDFRLMTRKVLTELQKLPENQRFMKGMFSWVGFRTIEFEYERKKRVGGKTKFNGWKLWNLALDGITSFSTVPLRIWTYMGIVIALCSFVYGSFIVIRTLVLGVDVPGYASLLACILFIGGIQLIGIGVLGEYIGRIYKESKRRPVYIVNDEDSDI